MGGIQRTKEEIRGHVRLLLKDMRENWYYYLQVVEVLQTRNVYPLNLIMLVLEEELADKDALK